MVLEAETGLGGGTTGDPFRIDLSASAKGFQSDGCALSSVFTVESPVPEEADVVLATGFLLKLGSLALGFEKKLESDCAPFTTELVVADAEPAVALLLGADAVEVDERLPSEGSFLTIALAPDGVEIIDFFAGGARDLVDEVEVLDVADDLEGGRVAESGCFRFFAFVSTVHKNNENCGIIRSICDELTWINLCFLHSDGLFPPRFYLGCHILDGCW